jgi:hypothetical protein
MKLVKFYHSHFFCQEKNGALFSPLTIPLQDRPTKGQLPIDKAKKKTVKYLSCVPI